ncbi:MAG: hypothetical protein KDD41_07555 [Flavobacteriales bacterium]|nr:hypothetical protein [Flavobacteriales bacterium]
MKKVVSILGFLITVMLLAGIIFKILHWPGAGVLIIVSTSSLSLYLIPVAISNILNYEKKVFIAICNGVGAFGGMILSTGMLFKIMHWPGSGSMTVIGLFFSVIVLFLFMIFYFTSKEKIYLSPGTFYTVACFGLLTYGIGVGGSTKSLLDNVVVNAENIEDNANNLRLYNTKLNVTQFHKDNLRIYNTTEDLNVYLINLKSKLYEVVDKYPKEVADTISLKYIQSKDNCDIPTWLMGLGDPVNPTKTPGLEEYSAITLREKLDEFNTIAKEFNPDGLVFSTNNYKNYNGGYDSWETHMFYHYTLSQVILTLNEIQLQANITCNTIMTNNLLNKNTLQTDTIN